MKIPDSIDERQKMFEFKEKPVVAGILLDFLLDVLLMPYRFVNYLLEIQRSGKKPLGTGSILLYSIHVTYNLLKID